MEVFQVVVSGISDTTQQYMGPPVVCEPSNVSGLVGLFGK